MSTADTSREMLGELEGLLIESQRGIELEGGNKGTEALAREAGKLFRDSALLPFGEPKKVILENYQSPGDLVMMTAAVRDLHRAYPNKFITDVRTSCGDVWLNNPHITHVDDKDQSAIRVRAEYPLIHQSNGGALPFIHGFAQDLADKLGVPRFPITKYAGDIHISAQESSWYSAPREILGKDVPYWVIDAGYKSDFTCKNWGKKNWQQLVEMCPEIQFVQIGHRDHIHPKLAGDNVIDLVGKTDTRQLIRLVYNSFGVVTPCSFPFVLAYSIPPHPRFKRKSRPCVVVAGGREPVEWQQAPNVMFMHTCGALPCCDYGGCWVSRVKPIGDGDHKDKNTCLHPVACGDEFIPRCMQMIRADHVAYWIETTTEELDFE